MDNLINKIGLDKIAHFGIGGIICAFMTFIVMLQEIHSFGYKQILLCPFVGYFVTAFWSVIKEYFFDGPRADWKDIVAGMLGCVFIHISVCVGVLFNYWTLQIQQL